MHVQVLKKLKVEQKKQEVEMHIIVYDEMLSQLQYDLENKWQNEFKSTDLKKYLHDFSQSLVLKPEIREKLEEYDKSSEHFVTTLKFIGGKLNESGMHHIMLVDEVDLKHIPSKVTTDSDGDKILEIDLSFVAEFTNVHFVFCLRPTSNRLKNFIIEFPSKKENQLFFWLKNVYRNARPIQEFIQYIQYMDSHAKEGFPSIKKLLEENKLPPSLVPSSINSSIVWIPTTPLVEYQAIRKLYFIMHELHQSPPTILYTADSDSESDSYELAMKIKNENPEWLGPHNHLKFNGGEADAIVLITGSNLNIQTLARARRLLIIVTQEKEWNSQMPLVLKRATYNNLIQMIGVPDFDCPYYMVKCGLCGLDFDDSSKEQHTNEDCFERLVTCHHDGCPWNGKAKELQHHSKTCQFELTQGRANAVADWYQEAVGNWHQKMVNAVADSIRHTGTWQKFLKK